ncbi:MAG: hypothetical protein G01um101470_774, partial [Parcubacteria group bacterium Gr01-1014_70]
MRFFSILITIFALAIPASAAADSSFESVRQSVRGMYAIGTPNQPFEDAVATNQFIDGLSIRTVWASVQPVESSYNWSYIDGEVARAKANGKKFSLSVRAGSKTPEWVYVAGARRFYSIGVDQGAGNFCQDVIIPVPFDAVYLIKWKNFVAALGNRYGADSSLAFVRIT